MDISVIGQQAINGLVLGCTYGLIAIGYTMVYGIIGMINFAHGEVYMVAAYLSAIAIAVLTFWGISSPAALIILSLLFVMVLTSLYGYYIEKIAYKPLRGANRLSPLISAIGMSLILQNYVNLSQGASNQGIPALVSGFLRFPPESAESGSAFVQITYTQLLIVVVSFAAMAALHFFIKSTSMGRACRATQQDEFMASILGINTNKVISIVFIIGASMAAIAGLLVSLNYGSFDFTIGFITGIKAFTAAVLGGIGSLPGAMLGGVFLGLAESLFSGFVNTDYKDVFAFSLLVIILVFKPSGILGRPEVEKV